MTTVAIHQPAYLPWLGYFYEIASADCFVYLETVQFEKNYYTNRNRIRTPQGDTLWLTVPVLMKGHTGRTIRDMRINPTDNWARRHCLTIEQHYRKAPYFDAYWPELSGLLNTRETSLTELLHRQLQYFLRILGITTRVVRSQQLDLQERKAGLVLEACRALGADRYISGVQGRNYLSLDDFRAAGISVLYNEFRHPEYPQQGGGFIPCLGIIDLLFNAGAERTREIIDGCDCLVP